MKEKRNTIFAWILFSLITIATLGTEVYRWSTRPAGEQFHLAGIFSPLVPVVFTFVAALIISQQPRNAVGWLLMLPGLSLFTVIDGYLEPYINGLLPIPASPSLGFFLIVWFSGWNWILLVFPILFMMVLFPTGKPLGPRWGWLVYYGLGMMVLMIFFGSISQSLEPGAGGILVPNPIGFLSEEILNLVFIPWLISLPILTLLCAASLFVRFRRAKGVERQQIKWLFYAAAIFAAFYVPTFIGNAFSDAENFWNILFVFGLLAIPTAIAISILRYRLYDIDVIIRRTLQYALLTGLLALIYFGGVVVIQSIFRSLTGNPDSPLVTVISTLTIAAIFNPLKNRVQAFIDRRFFRGKYNPERSLANFALVARDEVDMDNLTAALLGIVEATMQPEKASLWMKPAEKRQKSSP